MRAIIIAFTILVTASPLCAQELRHFDPGVFGKSIEEPVLLLLPGPADAMEPISILTDLSRGKYFAATVHYPRSVTIDQARESLNGLYKQYEKQSFAHNPEMGLWRVEDRRFGIQLTRTDESTRVIYVPFMSEEAWEHSAKADGVPLGKKFWECIEKRLKGAEQSDSLKPRKLNPVPCRSER